MGGEQPQAPRGATSTAGGAAPAWRRAGWRRGSALKALLLARAPRLGGARAGDPVVRKGARVGSLVLEVHLGWDCLPLGLGMGLSLPTGQTVLKDREEVTRVCETQG